MANASAERRRRSEPNTLVIGSALREFVTRIRIRVASGANAAPAVAKLAGGRRQLGADTATRTAAAGVTWRVHRQRLLADTFFERGYWGWANAFVAAVSPRGSASLIGAHCGPTSFRVRLHAIASANAGERRRLSGGRLAWRIRIRLVYVLGISHAGRLRR